MLNVAFSTATRISELQAVYELTYRVYSEEGYCQRRDDGRLQHYPHLDEIAETTVVIGRVDNKLIGSVSVTVDGPLGLHADDDFPAAMRIVRQGLGGKVLGAGWRMVTDNTFRNNRRFALRLFREGFLVVLDRGIETLVSIINPRHVSFYQRFLGYEKLTEGACKYVGGEDAVLMMYDVETNGVPVRLR